MNEAQKSLVTALRSGKYEQGKNRLNRDGKYCCLGVACELYQEQVGGLNKIRCDYDLLLTAYNKQVAALPVEVQYWLEMNMTGLGEFIATQEVIDIVAPYETLSMLKVGDVSCLAALNDNGVTFEDIAKVIELDILLKERDGR